MELRIARHGSVTSDACGVLPSTFAPRQAVRLVAAGHAAVEFRLPRRAPESEPVLLVRLPPLAEIRGRINEAEGPPIPGAKVRVNGYAVDTPQDGTTFGDAVIAQAGGAGVEIKVPAPGGFEGRIIDGATGKLLDDRVFPNLVVKAGESVPLMGRKTQFKGGVVLARGLPPGTYHIVVRDRQCTRGVIMESVRVRSGQTVRGLEFRVRPGGKLNLRFHPDWGGFKSIHLAVSGPDNCWIDADELDATRPRPVSVLAGKLQLRLMAVRHIDGDRTAVWTTRVEVPSGGALEVRVPAPSKDDSWKGDD